MASSALKLLAQKAKKRLSSAGQTITEKTISKTTFAYLAPGSYAIVASKQSLEDDPLYDKVCIHSAATTHASLSLICRQPKLPSLAPRSGTATTSVLRMMQSFSGLNSAKNNGARWRKTWSLSAPRRV